VFTHVYPQYVSYSHRQTDRQTDRKDVLTVQTPGKGMSAFQNSRVVQLQQKKIVHIKSVIFDTEMSLKEFLTKTNVPKISLGTLPASKQIQENGQA
jgi:hypothetical protein